MKALQQHRGELLFLVLLLLLILTGIILFWQRSPRTHKIELSSELSNKKVEFINDQYLREFITSLGFFDNIIDLNSVDYTSSYRGSLVQITVSNLKIVLTNKPQPLGKFVSAVSQQTSVVESFGIDYQNETNSLILYLYLNPGMNKGKSNEFIGTRYSSSLLGALYQLTHMKLTPTQYQNQIIIFRKHINSVPEKTFFKITDE